MLRGTQNGGSEVDKWMTRMIEYGLEEDKATCTNLNDPNFEVVNYINPIKKHKNKIEVLKGLETARINFHPSSYIDSNNKTRPCIDIRYVNSNHLPDISTQMIKTQVQNRLQIYSIRALYFNSSEVLG